MHTYHHALMIMNNITCISNNLYEPSELLLASISLAIKVFVFVTLVDTYMTFNVH